VTETRLYNFRKVFAFIIKLLPPFKFNIFVMLVVAMIWAFDLSFRQYIIKNILNGLVGSEGVGVAEQIWQPACMYIFMALLITTTFRAYGYFVDVRMCPALRQNIAKFAFQKLLTHSHVYYQSNFAGSLTHKVNNLTDSIIELVKLSIDRFFGCSLALILSIYTLFLVNINFALVTLIWAGISTIMSIFYFQKLSDLSRDYSASSASVSANIADSLINITTIRLFHSRFSEQYKLFKVCRKKLIAERKFNWTFFLIWCIHGYSFNFLQIISLYFLIDGYQAGTITIGDFALVIGLNLEIVDFLNRLVKELALFSDHYGRVVDALSTIFIDSELQDQIDAKPLKVASGKISFDKISFAYEGKKPLFDNFSVTINPKQKVGLVGYSGSGKSSFINLILRLFDLDAGKIIIDGQSITEVKQHSLRQKLAVVPQDLILFHNTLIANIRYGKFDASDEEIIRASRFAGIHEFISGLPCGYDTIVGEKGIKLSGGERQRVLIARAFIKNAPILLLDEATNQLDSITEQEIQNSLFKLMEDKTTIVIAHRLSTLLHMDRILVFEQGKIVQDGTHDELIVQGGLYRKLWNAQSNDMIRY